MASQTSDHGPRPTPARRPRLSPNGGLHPCIDLFPSYDGHTDSIMSTRAYYLLMSNVPAMEFFNDSKQPLQWDMIAGNKEVREAIQHLEPGPKISWEFLPIKINQVKSKLSHAVPQLFFHLDHMMKVHEEFIETTIKFMNYDLHSHMIKALFSQDRDPRVLELFGTPEWKHRAEIMIHQDTTYMKQLEDQRVNTYTAAEGAAAAMMDLKCAKSTWESMDQLEFLVKQEHEAQAAAAATEFEKATEIERARARRAVAVQEASERAQERQNLNLGPIGTAPLPAAVVQAMDDHHAAQAQLYLDHMNEDVGSQGDLPGNI